MQSYLSYKKRYERIYAKKIWLTHERTVNIRDSIRLIHYRKEQYFKEKCCWYCYICLSIFFFFLSKCVLVSECPDGKYGQNCRENCSATCNSCNKKSGFCEYGCKPGWKGDNCETGIVFISIDCTCSQKDC